MKEVILKVKEALIRASSSFRPDQCDVYACAIKNECEAKSKWVLENLLLNAQVAEKNSSPLCDDTGIPHLFLEIGPNQTLNSDMLDAIQVGVVEGLKTLPGRPMAVRGGDIERIEQSEGMYEDPAALEPAPLLIKRIEEECIRLTVLMLGGGPAIRGRTQSIFHKHDVNVVVEEIVNYSKSAVAKLGCSPCTLAVGMGRSQFEASSMMMEAMVYGNFSVQSELEKRITKKVNEAQVGALGLGGNHSVLATFLKVGPQRASGVRVVAIRPCCCVEPRKARIVLS